jgi:glyoxylase-like metal-dependent hydrolase (beta-lactamase superfamily II)
VSGGGAEHAPRIEVGAFPPWDTNAYLVWDGSAPEALVLDPGMNSTDSLVARAAANGLRVHLIANSHGHIDHIFDNGPLKRATNAPLAIHPDDAYRLDGRNNYGFEIEQVTAERQLREGERVEVGRLAFEVLHTPGHTEGSVCLYEPTHRLLLAGDVLFAGSYGRTDLPGGDSAAMVESLARLARDLQDDVRVLPGHGPETTIGRERPWMERIARAGRLLIPG